MRARIDHRPVPPWDWNERDLGYAPMRPSRPDRQNLPRRLPRRRLPRQPSRPARLGVGVVGAGRVGSVLGAALRRRRAHRRGACPAVSDASRRRADELLPGVPVLSPYDVLDGAELVLLTVPDDVLPGLVVGAAAAGAFQPGQLVVHTSGRYGVRVLDPATRAGGLPLALHPVMTFTGTAVDLARLAGCVLRRDRARAAAAGRRGAGRRDGRRAGVDRGGGPPALPRGARARRQPPRHPGRRVGRPAAPVPASRSRNGCSARCSVPRSTTRCAPATPALTGPVARGDAGTVAAHVASCAPSRRDPRRPTSRWPGSPPTGRWRPGCSTRQAAEALLDVLAEPDRPTRDHPSVRTPASLPRRRGHPRRAGEPGPAGGPVAVVMTMGALHEGHAALIEVARRRCAVIVVTVFLNPLQFGAVRGPLALSPDPRRRPRPVRAARTSTSSSRRTSAEVYPDGEPQVRVARRPARRRARGSARARATSTACSPWWPSCCT